MAIVNLTPHNITIYRDSDSITIEPSGDVMRVLESSTLVGDVDGVWLIRTESGPLQVLRDGVAQEIPPAVPGTVYVVSAFCAERIRSMGRHDFATPGDLVRNSAGQVIGCKNLRVI